MRLAASAAAVLTVFSLTAPASAAPGRAPEPSAGETAEGAVRPKLPPPTPDAPTQVPATVATSALDCAKVKADPKKYIPKGRSEIGCVLAPTASRAAAAAAPAVSCAAVGSNIWVYWSAAQCVWGLARTFQTVNTAGGVTGTATFEVAMDLAAGQSLGMTEKWFVTMTAATGRLATANVLLTKSCGTGCTTRNSPTAAQNITVGKTVTGTIPAAAAPLGRTAYVQNYTLTVTNASNDTIAPSTWKAPWNLRCDRVITPAGCVLDGGLSSISLSYASVPTVVAGLLHYQNNYPDAWGRDTPVRHVADTSLRQASTTAMCAGFVPDSRVAGDTCFLFPFDSNYENGYLQGLFPANCSETRPIVNDNGTYSFELKHAVTYTERCFIGHVAAADVALFKQQFNTWVVANRILDQDDYLIRLTG